jgi:hypothetical protein
VSDTYATDVGRTRWHKRKLPRKIIGTLTGVQMSDGGGSKIVVRQHKRTSEHRAGVASEMPLRDWITIQEFGSWSARQQTYQPFAQAELAAQKLARALNRLDAQVGPNSKNVPNLQLSGVARYDNR